VENCTFGKSKLLQTQGMASAFLSQAIVRPGASIFLKQSPDRNREGALRLSSGERIPQSRRGGSSTSDLDIVHRTAHSLSKRCVSRGLLSTPRTVKGANCKCLCKTSAILMGRTLLSVRDLPPLVAHS
jgi:hypothetical protein